MLYDDQGEALMEYKRVMRGVSLFKDKEEVGSMKFEKRKLVCEYEIYLYEKHIGRLAPDGIMHKNMTIERGGKVIGEFTKDAVFSSLLELEMYEEVEKEELYAYFGAVAIAGLN